MKATSWLVCIFFTLTLAVSACGATPTPAPTQEVLGPGCNDLWILSPEQIVVPTGGQIEFNYEWSGQPWIATITCPDGWLYKIVDDHPVFPNGQVFEKECGKTTIVVRGVTDAKFKCGESFYLVDPVPQIGTRLINTKGEEVIVDVRFERDKAENELKYWIVGGYPATGQFADLRCTFRTPEFDYITGSSYWYEWIKGTTYTAVCGSSEGFTIEMSTH